MKKTLPLTATLIAALAAGAAQAQGLELSGGEITYSSTRNDTFGDSLNMLEGSAVLESGSGFGAQIDFSYGKYSSGFPTIKTAGVHLFYGITPSLTGGMYFTREVISLSPDANSYGAELAYDAGKLAVEAQIGKIDAVGLPDTFSIASIEVSYGLSESLSVGIGAQNLNDGTDTLRQVSVGGKYSFGNGMNVEARYYRRTDTALPGPENAVGIRFGYEFGKGAAFGGRGFFQQFP